MSGHDRNTLSVFRHVSFGESHPRAGCRARRVQCLAARTRQHSEIPLWRRASAVARPKDRPPGRSIAGSVGSWQRGFAASEAIASPIAWHAVWEPRHPPIHRPCPQLVQGQCHPQPWNHRVTDLLITQRITCGRKACQASRGRLQRSERQSACCAPG